MEAWEQFFIRANIPKDAAKKYAKSFHTNRITKEMLPELDKPTLSDLGVTIIGDQLLILKRIKQAKELLSKEEDESMNSDEEMVEEERMPIKAPTEQSSSRRGKPPPDSHEIYHVKMPMGTTKRSQQILEKAQKLKSKGLTVRGTTGVRQGGRSVSPIDKSSIVARLTKKQSDEVSSTTEKDVEVRLSSKSLGSRLERNTKGAKSGSNIYSRMQKSEQIRISMTKQPLKSRLEKKRVTNNKKANSRRNGVGDETLVVIKNPRMNEYLMEEEGEEFLEDDQLEHVEYMEEEDEPVYVQEKPLRDRISFGNRREQERRRPIFSRVEFRR